MGGGGHGWIGRLTLESLVSIMLVDEDIVWQKLGRQSPEKAQTRRGGTGRGVNALLWISRGPPKSAGQRGCMLPIRRGTDSTAT